MNRETLRPAMDLSKAPKEAFRFASPVEMAGTGEQQRRFRGVAYSGKPITDHFFWGQVVFDLSSVRSEPRVPALREHDPDKIVGHTEVVNIGSNITVEGVLDPTEFSAEVARLSDAGFPWQMSVHIVPGSIEEIKAGAKATINGHEVIGPAHVFKNARIREVSFCPVGADPNTSAIALSAFQETNMDLAALQKQVSEQAAQIAQLTEANARLTAENSSLQERFTAATRAQRQAAVRELFSATGIEFNDANAAPYMAMDDATFSAVAAQMKSLKPKAGEHLFTEQAIGGQGGESALVRDAKRRAEQFGASRK